MFLCVDPMFDFVYHETVHSFVSTHVHVCVCARVCMLVTYNSCYPSRVFVHV